MGKTAAKILIGVSSRSGKVPDTRFLESLPPFYAKVAAEFDVGLHWVVGKWLDAAQNDLAEYAIQHGYTHLLILEDDHWGHSIEMFRALMEGIDDEHPVVAIPYHSRYYPFLLTAMVHKEGEQVRDSEGKWTDFYTEVHQNGGGYRDVDLCSFGMMMIRTDIFQKLHHPYFRFSDEVLTTDNTFCKSLREVGVRPRVCFDHILPHRDITPDTVREAIEKQAYDRLMFRIWRRGKKKAMYAARGMDRLRKFMVIARRGDADIKSQIQVLENLTTLINAQTVVELGTRQGVSLSAFTAGVMQTGGHVWTYDNRYFDVHWWDDEFSTYVTRNIGDDRTVDLPVNSIDLLFIDTSHIETHTREELARWGPLVRKGGLIVLHDTVACEEGVGIPARDFVKEHKLEYLEDMRQCGLGVILVNKSLEKEVV